MIIRNWIKFRWDLVIVTCTTVLHFSCVSLGYIKLATVILFVFLLLLGWHLQICRHCLWRPTARKNRPSSVTRCWMKCPVFYASCLSEWLDSICASLIRLGSIVARLPSSKQYLSKDDSVEDKMEDCHNFSMLYAYCLLLLCTIICTVGLWMR